MIAKMISKATCLAAFGGLVLFTACSTAHDPQVAGDPAPVTLPKPVPAYQFFEPKTEQELKDHSNYGFLIAKLAPGASPDLFTREGLAVEGQLVANGARYFLLHKEGDVLETLKRLQVTQGVMFVEPDQTLSTDVGFTMDKPDPLLAGQEYSMSITKATEAWKTFGFGVYCPWVADIDTGLNWSHEDFTQADGTRIVKHAFSWQDLATGTMVNTSANPDADPIDYFGNAQYPNLDPAGHGTHTAGTICAAGNNGKGVAGVCWQAELIHYRAQYGTGLTSWGCYGSLHNLVLYRTKTGYPGTVPVNFSIGGATPSYFQLDMIDEALRNNIVMICSMGNDGQRIAKYPSCYPGVIAVGATNGRDEKVPFSTLGPTISVSAPGFSIVSTGYGSSSDYAMMSGTSMATPFVTGLVTYMLTFNPNLTPGQIKTYLEKNADDIGAPGFDEGTGWGRVNVFKTIQAVVNDLNSKTTPATTFATNSLQVTVVNQQGTGSFVLPGVRVFLYTADDKGAVTNYVSCAVTDPDGKVNFGLLRPGTYVATASYMGLPMSTQPLKVEAGKDVAPQFITSPLVPYQVQTLVDEGDCTKTDTVITFYNTLGQPLYRVDSASLDSALVGLAPGATYIIGITPYNSTTVGEYALYVSKKAFEAAKVPGTFAAPVGTAGSQAHSKTAPQVISLDTPYNCKLTTAGDYYKVTIP